MTTSGRGPQARVAGHRPDVRGVINAILPTPPLFLFAPQGGAERFARLFGETWREIPSSARRRIIESWQAQPRDSGEVVPRVELLDGWEGTGWCGPTALIARRGLLLKFRKPIIDGRTDDEARELIAWVLALVCQFASGGGAAGQDSAGFDDAMGADDLMAGVGLRSRRDGRPGRGTPARRDAQVRRPAHLGGRALLPRFPAAGRRSRTLSDCRATLDRRGRYRPRTHEKPARDVRGPTARSSSPGLTTRLFAGGGPAGPPVANRWSVQGGPPDPRPAGTRERKAQGGTLSSARHLGEFRIITLSPAAAAARQPLRALGRDGTGIALRIA
jgi:hypothetical protein